eukprot:547-Pelagococcus_subviridis.AAC.1
MSERNCREVVHRDVAVRMRPRGGYHRAPARLHRGIDRRTRIRIVVVLLIGTWRREMRRRRRQRLRRDFRTRAARRDDGCGGAAAALRAVRVALE